MIFWVFPRLEDDLYEPPATKNEMIEAMIGERAKEVRAFAELCDGCMDCIEACKGAVGSNGEAPAIARITIKEEEGLHFPVLCRNCEEAPCVASCMPGARIKKDGFTKTDYSKCVGCWMCIMACPFGAIERVAEEHLAYKCEGCLDEDTPACVKSCKPKALIKAGPVRYAHDKRRENAAAYFLGAEE